MACVYFSEEIGKNVTIPFFTTHISKNYFLMDILNQSQALC